MLSKLAIKMLKTMVVILRYYNLIIDTIPANIVINCYIAVLQCSICFLMHWLGLTVLSKEKTHSTAA